MKIVKRQNGFITIFSFVLIFPVFAIMLYLLNIIMASVLHNKAIIAVNNAAKSGAAIISTQGEDDAINFTLNLLSQFPEKSVTISDCNFQRCLTAKITYKGYNITAKAANYTQIPNQTPKIGSYLLP